MTGFIIFLVVLAVIALLSISIYNRLVVLFQYRKNSFSNIDVQLKQRIDLIPNLVAAVKGYATHEKGVLEEVTRARATAMHTSGSGSDRAAAESGVNNALMNLMMVSENYPELKADARFQQLQDELSDLENKIAASRRAFNHSTTEFNAFIKQFPAIFIASVVGYKEENFLEFDAAERKEMAKAPTVSFA